VVGPKETAPNGISTKNPKMAKTSISKCVSRGGRSNNLPLSSHRKGEARDLKPKKSRTSMPRTMEKGEDTGRGLWRREEAGRHCP